MHLIVRVQRKADADHQMLLWRFGRQKGWRLIKVVMTRARVFGERACARGLRHTFGVQAILSGIPLTQLQIWLGHASLKTTAIYLSIIGVEDRSLAARLWAYRAA